MHKALKEFGAPLKGIKPRDFTRKDLVYQIGVAPIRVDVMMGVPGLEFEPAWRRRTKSAYDGVRINLLSKKDIITAKKKIGRPQDKEDIRRLES